MRETAINVEKISKRYRIGSKEKINDTLSGAMIALLKSPFSNLKRLRKLSSFDDNENQEDVIWALKDISFSIKPGEVVGIVGLNGAGKSTLLKIISQITKPTSGRVVFNGRVSSLLEVGTGFHPELTGRENIYLNGTILGMTKAEIDRKFDEIVGFSEIEKFLDTPVKRYSSGMTVRLAFSVAAHLEPEILLIDEVLAVGDASFQKKCLGKMGDVAKKGRTILFVSHNLAAVRKLCDRSILLCNGKLTADGNTSEVLNIYQKASFASASSGGIYTIDRKQMKNTTHPDMQITNIKLLSESNENLEYLGTGDPLRIGIEYIAKKQFPTAVFAVFLKTIYGQEILRLATTPISGFHVGNLFSKGYIEVFIKALPVTSGLYYFDVGFFLEKTEMILMLEQVISLNVELKDVYGSGLALDQKRGLIVVPHSWKHRSL